MQQKGYKTVKKIFLCVMRCLEQLFKCASLATLSNVFQEFQVIYKLLNILFTQLQNHLYSILKQIQSIIVIQYM